jgi:hypothetical protein
MKIREKLKNSSPTPIFEEKEKKRTLVAYFLSSRVKKDIFFYPSMSCPWIPERNQAQPRRQI